MESVVFFQLNTVDTQCPEFIFIALSLLDDLKHSLFLTQFLVNSFVYHFYTERATLHVCTGENSSSD